MCTIARLAKRRRVLWLATETLTIACLRVARAQALKDAKDDAHPLGSLKTAFRKDAMAKVIKTARTAKTAHEYLKDPPLPGKADVDRWYPDASSPRSPRVLVPVPRPPSALTAASSPRPPTPASFAAAGRTRDYRPRPATARAVSEPAGTSIHFAAGSDDRADATAFGAAKASTHDTQAAQRSVLAHWLATFASGEEAFASKAVFVEMRLRQALACSAMLSTPNTFRCAIVCDAWERVAPLTGRLEGVLSLLWSELLRCIYADYSDGLAGGGAKEFAARTPYFVEAQRLRSQHANQTDTIKLWQEQRNREMGVLAERNKSINHTLSAWNRALGFVAGTKHAGAISEQLYTLASNLTEANNETDRISRAAVTEPVTRVVEMFHQLGAMDQQTVLAQHLLPSAAASELMKSAPPDVVTGHLAKLTGKMSEANAAEALRPLVLELPVEEKQAVIADALSSGLPPTDVGKLFGDLYATLRGDGRSIMCTSLLAALDADAAEELKSSFGGGKKAAKAAKAAEAAAYKAAAAANAEASATPEQRHADVLAKQLDEEVARNREKEAALHDEIAQLKKAAAEQDARANALASQVMEMQKRSK